jgi:hypothetical protein
MVIMFSSNILQKKYLSNTIGKLGLLYNADGAKMGNTNNYLM